MVLVSADQYTFVRFPCLVMAGHVAACHHCKQGTRLLPACPYGYALAWTTGLAADQASIQTQAVCNGDWYICHLNCNDRALVHLSALKTMHVMLMGL